MNQVLMFLLFFIVVVSLFGLMQYRLYRVFRRWAAKVLDEPERQKWLKRVRRIIVLLNGWFLAQMAVRGTSVYGETLVQVILVYPMGLFFAMVVPAFLVALVIDLLKFIAWTGNRVIGLLPRRTSTRSPLPEPVLNPGRRRFLKLGGLSTASAIGAMPIIAFAQTARDYEINKVDLSFDSLPPGLEGLTIAQVSDIHSGIYMTEENMREIFEIVNSLDANAIMVTGDFVDTSDSQIEPLHKSIQILKAEYGIFGCMGNHDHFATARKVSSALEQSGITMLNNAHTNLTIDGEKLSIIGIDDAGRGQANFADWSRAADGIDPDSFKIALTHRPNEWDYSRQLGMDMTLAGHTHGGQVGFRLGPLNLNPVYLIHKYPMGLYSENNKRLYVNVGVGMVGVPIRLVKPEIALFTLKRA
jgi:hypothetical protein